MQFRPLEASHDPPDVFVDRFACPWCGVYLAPPFRLVCGIVYVGGDAAIDQSFAKFLQAVPREVVGDDIAILLGEREPENAIMPHFVGHCAVRAAVMHFAMGDVGGGQGVDGSPAAWDWRWLARLDGRLLMIEQPLLLELSMLPFGLRVVVHAKLDLAAVDDGKSATIAVAKQRRRFVFATARARFGFPGHVRIRILVAGSDFSCGTP